MRSARINERLELFAQFPSEVKPLISQLAVAESQETIRRERFQKWQEDWTKTHASLTSRLDEFDRQLASTAKTNSTPRMLSLFSGDARDEAVSAAQT